MAPTRYNLEQFESALEGVEERRAKNGTGVREKGSSVTRLSLDDPRLLASCPERVIEAIEVWPNNSETNPERLDFVKAMVAIKAALGPKREDYYGHVLKWALGYPDNDGKFVRSVWDSIKDAEVGADWLYRQARPFGFSGDAQDDFADPPYDPKSFFILDADAVRGRVDELVTLKFGWSEAYNEVLEYHEMMGVIEVGELEDLVAREAVKYGAAATAPQPSTAGVVPTLKYLLLDDVSTLPEPNDFLEGLLCDGQLSVIYGDTNVGKSFLVLDLAMHVALGRRRFDRDVERGAVVYLAGEGGGGMKHRVAAFLKRNGIEQTKDIPFALIPNTIDFRDKRSIAGLIETLNELRARWGCPIGWIIVDTLSRALAGGNENAPDDMGALVRGADQVRSSTGAHLSFIHHTGKDDSKGARGHSLLKAAVDTEIEVRRQDGIVKVTVTKQRDLETGTGFAFKLVEVELGQNARGKRVTSCVVEPAVVKPVLNEVEQEATEILQTLLFDSETTYVQLADWRSTIMSREDLLAGQSRDTKKRQWQRLRDSLKKKGIIEVSGDQVCLKH